MFLLLLSSGLFFGWSLGANDAANVFGTSVATRMLRFRTAAIICSIFVVLGAVISGAGATKTLGDLGSVNALGGAFTAALFAGVTVYWMTKLGFPVSTSQAIVGAIIGWNYFTGTLTDYSSLIKIVSTWVICPVLSAGFAAVLYLLVRWILKSTQIHLLRMDALTRTGLVLVGAFGAYSLGANNIANVMGIFVPACPFGSVTFAGAIQFSSAQLLFLLGGLAIALGVFTYSHRVMMTVGNDLVKLTPITALIVVLAHGIVLFLFASQSLESWLIRHGLPPIPLVPVSSSQAVIGGVIGIALVKGGKGIRYRVLGGIAASWIATPVIAGLLSFVALFFVQNVFELKVYRTVPYEITSVAYDRLDQAKIPLETLDDLRNVEFKSARQFEVALKARKKLSRGELEKALYFAEKDSLCVTPKNLGKIDTGWLTPLQVEALQSLADSSFSHKWQLHEALMKRTDQWHFRQQNRFYDSFNKELKRQLTHVYDTFRVGG
jgi:PiT family inorganic phosphate transporter